ncbi:MAG: gamma-glutamyltransferase family protein [Dongiaceae bacterium]
MGSRTFRSRDTTATTYYPRLFGRNFAVAAHHYLAAYAGAEILREGGNAVDAAVAATLVEGLVDPHMHTLGGECPMLIYDAGADRVWSVNGNTVAPARATPDAYRARGYTDVPDEGVLAAGVPAAFGALITALRRFGSLPFATVAAPAMAHAGAGFPAHRGLIAQEGFGLADLAPRLRSEWHGGAAIYLPEGRLPREGELVRNGALHDMLEQACHAERAAASRDAGLQAVFDCFYRGDVAAALHAHTSAHDGLFSREDFADFTVGVEAPVAYGFGGYEVYKCGPWNQGPALLLALGMLERFELERLGHNSADYIHVVLEAIKLAYADRNQYFGDPSFIQVPIAEMLSRRYGELRAGLIDIERASAEIRPGDPARGAAALAATRTPFLSHGSPGTVHVDVIDAQGNMAAFTPSGGWLKSSPVVATLGFPMTNRLMTFYLGPDDHPNQVRPGKQPRTTISPSLACGKHARMAFGSMGGDQQDQWQLQFLLNMIVFGMNMQAAIEAPKFSSSHFSAFFAPHDSAPKAVRMEPRIAAASIDELRRRGHEIELAADWTEGFILGARHDLETGSREAACDPRCAKSEIFAAAALSW